MVTITRGKKEAMIIKPLKLAATVTPITAAPDKAAEWTEKLIAKISTLPHQDAAHDAIAADAVGNRIRQLHESRPELEKAIYAAIDELPTNPAVSVATLIKRLNACKNVDAAADVMADPDADTLNDEDAGKLMAAYRERWGES